MLLVKGYKEMAGESLEITREFEALDNKAMKHTGHHQISMDASDLKRNEYKSRKKEYAKRQQLRVHR